MEKFVQTPLCPKCLNNDITYSYQKEIGDNEYSFFQPGNKLEPTPERLLMACKTCGHKWLMKTADTRND